MATSKAIAKGLLDFKKILYPDDPDRQNSFFFNKTEIAQFTGRNKDFVQVITAQMVPAMGKQGYWYEDVAKAILKVSNIGYKYGSRGGQPWT